MAEPGPGVTLLLLSLLAVWVILGVQTVVNLLVFRELDGGPDRQEPTEEWPRLSVVIPARNEERDIGSTLDAALSQDYPEFELVVVDDGSEDGTAAEITARAWAPRLLALSCPPPPEGWLGKTHALANGSAVASGEWLLFMDADIRLAPGALRRAVASAVRNRWDHLTLIPRFERKGFWEEVLMPSLPVFFFVFVPSFLSVLHWTRLAFGGGAFNLVRRSAYEHIGGHRRLANSVVDDVRLAIELKAAGYRSRLRLGRTVLSLRMYQGLGEIVEGFTKNVHAVWAGRWFVLSAASLAFLGLNLLPFGWIPWAVASWQEAIRSPGVFLGASLALLLASRLAVQRRLGFPAWPALFQPLMTLAVAGITARSLWVAHRNGVVRWRGREYPRKHTGF